MPSARDLAADLLLRVERKGGRVRDGLDAVRERLADPRERALLTELAYGTLRRRGTLDAVLRTFSKRPPARINAALLTALRLALYQAIFLDRVPGHAAVDHAVGWAARHAGAKRAGFVNGVLRNLLRAVEGPATGSAKPRRDVPREDGTALRFNRSVFPNAQVNLAGNLATRYAMPQWLVERWLARWGEARTTEVLHAGITRPPMTVRARRDPERLQALLRERDVACEAGPGPAALRIRDGEAALRLALEGGEAVVQDATSQRVAPLLELAPGRRVLDVCAAPGGKTLHVADLMQSGHVTACDVSADKLARLDALRPLVGDVAYETVLLEREAPLPFPDAAFDAILVDAPCTNTGVLRRRVEARWRLAREDVAALAEIQGALLDRCVPVLAPGGRLVYSTCSLEPEENEEVLAAFLGRHSAWTGEVAYRAWPCAEADGGFAAVLGRASGSP